MRIRFHLDQHIHAAIAVGLRAQGIDVTTAAEQGMAAADDAEHCAFGLSQQRVVVTHDNDFLRLDAQGVEHAGIAYCHQEKHSLRDHLQMLLLLHACYTAEEMRGRVEFL